MNRRRFVPVCPSAAKDVTNTVVAEATYEDRDVFLARSDAGYFWLTREGDRVCWISPEGKLKARLEVEGLSDDEYLQRMIDLPRVVDGFLVWVARTNLKPSASTNIDNANQRLARLDLHTGRLALGPSLGKSVRVEGLSLTGRSVLITEFGHPSSCQSILMRIDWNAPFPTHEVVGTISRDGITLLIEDHAVWFLSASGHPLRLWKLGETSIPIGSLPEGVNGSYSLVPLDSYALNLPKGVLLKISVGPESLDRVFFVRQSDRALLQCHPNAWNLTEASPRLHLWPRCFASHTFWSGYEAGWIIHESAWGKDETILEHAILRGDSSLRNRAIDFIVRSHAQQKSVPFDLLATMPEDLVQIASEFHACHFRRFLLERILSGALESGGAESSVDRPQAD